MNGSHQVQCPYCSTVADSKISDSESVFLIRKHVRDEHPEKKEV